MDIKLQLCLWLSVFVIGSASCPSFYGVTFEGKFYSVSGVPQYPSDHWINSSTELGSSGWHNFQFLFFHPLDGTLYGVMNKNFYKGPLPMGLSREDWITNATLIGTGGWNPFHLLFFDPDGVLYGVIWDKLRKRSPPPGSGGWVLTSTVVGSSGWSDFEFLFFDPEGILYGVQNGTFHKRSPPANESDDWLGNSTLIGSTGWSDFQFLFFTDYHREYMSPDYELYGVYEDTLYLVSQSDDWMASSTIVGSNGWSEFKFLMPGWQLS